MAQNCKLLTSELETFLASETRRYNHAATEYNSNEGNAVEHYCNALIGACWFVTPVSSLIEISTKVDIKS